MSLESQHIGIETSFTEQLFWSSLLGNYAILKHDNLVGCGHRTHPVSDDEDRLATYQVRKRFLDKSLIVNVKGSGSLIQQDDRGVLQESPCNRNPLTLSA